MSFSSDKSGVMVFNDEKREPLRIQDIVIDHVGKYKYLGVWLNEGRKYLEEHEENIIRKGKRNSSIMKLKALWNYNRYEVVRGIWKGVMVPGLSFGNGVLCMKSEVQSGLEIRQRSVGRLALGAHGKTPNERVQGDMEWSSFESREAISKLKFEQRLTEMDGTGWAPNVFKCLRMKSLNTKWTNRTRKLTFKYLHTDGVPEQITSVKKGVSREENVGEKNTGKISSNSVRQFTGEFFAVRGENRSFEDEGHIGLHFRITNILCAACHNEET
uniref:Tick transposon n=1 Tax=Ixodes ricinus TaxID=34613 RepID=A0A0K8RMQ1_IXORI